jgi:hypothetical protein
MNACRFVWALLGLGYRSHFCHERE